MAVGIVCAALVLAACNCGSSSEGTFEVFVSNTWDDTVSVVDGSSRAEIDAIDVGNEPRGLALSPDGTLLAVPNRFSNSLTLIDTGSHTVITTVPLLGSEPYNCCFLPNGSRIYVANKSGNSASDVSVVDVATRTELMLIPLDGYGPEGIAASPDGNFVYVVDRDSEEVEVIDTQTNTVIASGLDAPGDPRDADVTPDGSKLYVVGEGSLAVLQTSSVLTGQTAQTSTVYISEASGRDVVVSPDGQFVYVARGPWTGEVAVVSTATDTVVDTITLSTGGAYGIDITPEGDLAFVSNDGSEVAVVDLVQRAEIDTVTVGSSPKQLKVLRR